MPLYSKQSDDDDKPIDLAKWYFNKYTEYFKKINYLLTFIEYY